MLELPRRYISRYHAILLNYLLYLMSLDYTLGIWDREQDFRQAESAALSEILSLSEEIIQYAHDVLSEELRDNDTYLPFNYELQAKLLQRERQYVELFFERLKTDVQRAVLTSDTMEQLKDRLSDIQRRHTNFAIKASWTEPMELMFFYIYTMLQTIKEWGYDVYLQWHTVMDDRTCKLCASLNGKTVRLGEPFAYYRGTPIYRPPLHPSCRCALRRVIIRRGRGE